MDMNPNSPDMVKFSRACLDAWGPKAQLDMMIEEMAELTLAILHYDRNKGTLDNIFEEIADVELMCIQMRAIMNSITTTSDPSAIVHAWKEAKVTRTLVRLNESHPKVFKKYYP